LQALFIYREVMYVAEGRMPGATFYREVMYVAEGRMPGATFYREVK
jgi:hypothetical protein